MSYDEVKRDGEGPAACGVVGTPARASPTVLIDKHWAAREVTKCPYSRPLPKLMRIA